MYYYENKNNLSGLFDSKTKVSVPKEISQAAKELPGLKLELNKFNTIIDEYKKYVPYVLIGTLALGVFAVLMFSSKAKNYELHGR